MADWYLNRALTGFRSAVNGAYPKRDKSSDGTIGDAAHAARSSDHNPDADGSVDAWDMDVDLGVPNAAAEIERLKRVFEAHESSSYWIHNDRISFRDEGWKPRSYAYAGPNRNRHDKHVHWNTRTAYENSKKPWNLEGDDDVGWTDQIRRQDGSTAPAGVLLANTFDRTVDTQYRLIALAQAVEAIGAKVGLDDAELSQIRQAAQEGAENALSSLTPEAIAAAIPDALAQQVVDQLVARLEK